MSDDYKNPNFEILEKWAEFSEFAEHEGTGKPTFIGSIYSQTREGNLLLSGINNNYDSTGTLSVLYAKHMFMEFIKECRVKLYDVMASTESYADTKEMWDLFHSETLIKAEDALMGRLDHLVSKVIENQQIGEPDKEAERKKLFSSIAVVLKALSKCERDTYIQGGDIGKITNVSTHIHVFPEIAHALVALEGAPDGMYLCYIDNNGRASGFFGFFIKSNGTLCSISERIIEAYAGQHKNSRNARYSEKKQYELFPYNYIFEYAEHDYKGYATKHIINEEKLRFFNLGSDAYMPILLAMMMLTKRYEGNAFDGNKVFVDALMPVNYAKLTSGNDKSTALVPITNSQLAATNIIDIEFDTDGVLSNKYGTEFSYRQNKNKEKPLAYYETGQFEGFNQIFVDLYGEGFELDVEALFEQNQHLKLLPTPEQLAALTPEQIDKNKWDEHFGRRKKLDDTTDDMLIGTKGYMRLQAYYKARKQLADYIMERMDEAHEEFGKDRIKTWYPEQLKTHLGRVESLVLECERQKMFDRPFEYVQADNPNQKKWYGDITIDGCAFTIWRNESWRGPDGNRSDYISYDRILNAEKDRYKSTGWWCNHEPDRKASVFYTVSPHTWQSIEWLIKDLPKILKGWSERGVEGFAKGNSLLSVTDPVSDIITPFQRRGSFSYDKYSYSFKFAIGFSKREIRNMLKDHKPFKNVKVAD